MIVFIDCKLCKRAGWDQLVFILFFIHIKHFKSFIDRKDVVKIEQSEYILNHPAYKYALDVVNGDSHAGEYIVKECKKFLKDLDDEESKYFLNEEDLRLIDEFLKLVKMADGHRVGMTAYDSLAPFQWYFLANTLGWKHKSNPNKRRYQKSVLLIARKNGEQIA